MLYELVYGLPPDPVVTTRDLPSMWKAAATGAAMIDRQRARGRGAAGAGGRLARAGGADLTKPRRKRRSGGAGGGGNREAVMVDEVVLPCPGLTIVALPGAAASSWAARRRQIERT